ncbi:MAG TPA: M20/M25/M40 family metallo-hydrolase [Allosphingosinicella sp.]|nr:M20/M25/M40 family metallo-hydrolase [Allosphingosinicella sp.]
MRLAFLAALLISATAAASAQTPTNARPANAPADRWHAKAREIYAHAIGIPTVQGRGRVPELATYLQEQFRAGGLTGVTIHPYDVVRPDDHTAALILRWPAMRPSGRKAILLMAHMDVVEARREDWSRDPFELGEEGGYFYGRGSGDDKVGVVAITTALLRLRAEGFAPNRDIIVLFTGDEETGGDGADHAANQWLDPSTIDFALNADAGGGAFLENGTLLGFGIQTAEKTYQSYILTATNPGGHSSRPRPDNAIYALAHTLGRVEQHRFAPMLNETTRASLSHRAETADPPLAAAIRRWLANPNDGEAADIVEASPTEVGLTRTRCVATRLEGGHADNALPQLARATVNCRIFPGVDPATVLATLRGLGAPDNVAVEPVDVARPTDASPLRPDVVGAYTAAVRARHPGAAIVPDMSTGATDGLYFRARGVPVYGVEGSWIVTPADERAHGRDERLPVRAFYEDVDHWVDMIRRLAS